MGWRVDINNYESLSWEGGTVDKNQLPATVLVERMCSRRLHACAASASAGAAPPTTGRLLNLG